MRKILSLWLVAWLLIGPFPLSAATRTWSSAGSTDMNDAANYGGAGALLVTDDLVFDATSVVNATATANLKVNSITTTAAYSGAWSLATYAMTLGASGLFDGTGTLGLGVADTFNGNGATFHIGAGSGTVTATDCVIRWLGTGGVLDADKAITCGPMTLGASASLTNSGADVVTVSSATTPLTLGANASLTINAAMTFSMYGTGDILSLGSGSSITGSAITKLDNAGNGITVTIPAVTFGGTISLWIIQSLGGATTTTQLSGNIVASGGNPRIYSLGVGAASTCNFYTNNYSMDFGTRTVTIGTNGVTWASNYNFGSSQITCGTIDFSVINSGPTVVNADSCNVKSSGNVTLGTNTQWVPTADTLTADGAGNQTITTPYDTLGHLRVNKASGVLSTANSLAALSFGVDNGTLDIGHDTITSLGSFKVAGTGILLDTAAVCNFHDSIDFASGAKRYPAAGTITTKYNALKTAGTQTMRLSGNVLPDFRHNGAGGTLVLLDTVIFNDTLYLLAGAFLQNGQNIHTNHLRWNTTDAGTVLDANCVLGDAIRTAGSAGSHTGTLLMRSLGSITSGGHRWHVMLITNTSTVTLNDIGAFDSVYVDGGSALVTAASGDTIDNARIQGTLNTSGDIIVFVDALTFLPASVLTIDGTTEHWFVGDGAVLTTAAMTQPITRFWNNYRIIAGATFGRLINSATGITGTFEASQTFTLTAVATGDWNGAANLLNKLRSTANGTHYTLNVPAGAYTMRYMNPRDCWITGGDVVWTNSVSGGGNR